LLFSPEDGFSTFFWNVIQLLPQFMAPHPKYFSLKSHRSTYTHYKHGQPSSSAMAARKDCGRRCCTFASNHSRNSSTKFMWYVVQFHLYYILYPFLSIPSKKQDFSALWSVICLEKCPHACGEISYKQSVQNNL
jgi:hypothetical protein